ncbi:MAG: hypothetical protein NTW80_02270 [Deltaproteobacteria bacterium]|nr:hypothetical protein [Deltaproteobacteria bacterium]
MFEDDARPHNCHGEAHCDSEGADPPTNTPHLNALQRLAESLIYYRTADKKNRLVVFLN